jgi:hypothetical protein
LAWESVGDDIYGWEVGSVDFGYVAPTWYVGPQVAEGLLTVFVPLNLKFAFVAGGFKTEVKSSDPCE